MNERVLRTDRLWLRPVMPADVPSLHALFTDPEVRRYLWDDRAVSLEEVRELVASSRSTFEARAFGHWSIRRSDADRIVGVSGLRPIDAGGEVELLYALEPALWGAGLAHEAAGAVLADGLTTAALECILARIDPPNLRSIRLAERLGMKSLGVRSVDGVPVAHYAARREAFSG
jgi:ribosomal-protein-alanine N-acetyltransferase